MIKITEFDFKDIFEEIRAQKEGFEDSICHSPEVVRISGRTFEKPAYKIGEMHERVFHRYYYIYRDPISGHICLAIGGDEGCVQDPTWIPDGYWQWLPEDLEEVVRPYFLSYWKQIYLGEVI